MKRIRIILALSAAGGLGLLGLVAAPPAARAAACTYPAEATSWGRANLISAADSDAEGSAGIWTARANTTVSDDTATAFHGTGSLRLTAAAAGSQVASMGYGSTATEVPVTAGDTYRVSAWVKTQGGSGRTLEEQLGFFDASCTWLGWVSQTQALAATAGWQYVSGLFTAPAGAAVFAGSPKLTEAGVSAGETLNLDEILVEPYRAATIIGAKDNSAGGTGFPATDSAIGPLQSDRMFYSTTLPSSYGSSLCASLPATVTCIVSYKTQTVNVASFVSSIPAGRNTIISYHHEPENDTFANGGNCNLGSNGANFVCQFEGQSDLIRSSVTAANRANVWVAMIAEDYQYDAGTSHNLGGAGGGCYFIPPAGYEDFLFADHYEETASGSSLPDDPGSEAEWDGWLGCASPQDKPVGLAEYGLNGANSSGGYANALSTSQAMAADNSYLEGQPDGLPVVLWEYWYYDSNGTWVFTPGGSPDGTQAVSQWQADETQNGGGAN